MPKKQTPLPGCYIGIDPGASGAICAITEYETPGTRRLHLHKMPQTEQDVWNLVSSIEDAYRSIGVFAFIEKVGGYISGGEGGDGQKGGGAANGSSMFKFGKSYGGLRMCLIGLGIPFQEVIPQTWQKSFALKRLPSEKKADFKRRGKAIAQQLFPSENVIGDVADGLLIAEYCRRIQRTIRSQT